MATLRLFAGAREAAGTGKETIHEKTVGEVLASARERFGPDFGDVLDQSRIWVNGDEAEHSDTVGTDDEVAVLPPVSGG